MRRGPEGGQQRRRQAHQANRKGTDPVTRTSGPVPGIREVSIILACVSFSLGCGSASPVVKSEEPSRGRPSVDQLVGKLPEVREGREPPHRIKCRPLPTGGYNCRVDYRQGPGLLCYAETDAAGQRLLRWACTGGLEPARG